MAGRGPVAYLAGVIGAPEAGIRLLTSVAATYPLGWILGTAPFKGRPQLTLLILAVTGLSAGLFNFGLTMGHGIIAVLFSYFSTMLLGPTKLSVIVNFIFHMGYLLSGYWSTGTDTYDIKWTMPHCVLALRLIGLSFDLWDGSKPPEKLSKSNLETALKQPPNLLEVTAYVFFPPSYLVGPQFSMVRFKNYLAGKYENVPQPSCTEAGLKRAFLGILYLIVYQVGTMYFPDDYFLTDRFNETSFVKKHIIMGIWGKIVLSKYIACWLLTEGACITYGLAHNGIDKDTNKSMWDGCRNVRTGLYEGLTKFGHYIDSFNINTNAWVAQYIYKRAAFLGNRLLSQGLTLLFLAVWHGFHSGYYMSFFLEFIIMMMEKEFITIIEKSKILDKYKSNSMFKLFLFIFLKFYVTIFMGYCLLPFTLLSFAKWWSVYRSLYFSGFILFLPWMFVYKPILKMVLKPKKTDTEKQQ